MTSETYDVPPRLIVTPIEKGKNSGPYKSAQCNAAGCRRLLDVSPFGSSYAECKNLFGQHLRDFHQGVNPAEEWLLVVVDSKPDGSQTVIPMS